MENDVGDADEENNDKDIINITDKVHLSEMLYFLLYLEIFISTSQC